MRRDLRSRLQRRMGISGGREVLLDTDVELLSTDADPDSSTTCEGLGLLDLGEPEQYTEESPRLRLAAGSRDQLHVVKPNDAHHIRTR
jgi:hypothetical protein